MIIASWIKLAMAARADPTVLPTLAAAVLSVSAAAAAGAGTSATAAIGGGDGGRLGRGHARHPRHRARRRFCRRLVAVRTTPVDGARPPRGRPGAAVRL